MLETRMEYEDNIVVRDARILFSNDEVNEMNYVLNQQNIGIDFFETRSIQNSIFQGVFIYISNHLAEIIATSIIPSLAYDTMKKVFFSIYSRVSNAFHKANNHKDTVSIRMKLENTDIIIPVPDYLNDNQFGQYMDAIKDILPKIVNTQTSDRYKQVIIEPNESTNKLTVKTMEEYIHSTLQDKE